MISLILLRLLESFFRHWRVYLLPIILMAGLAVLQFLTATPSFISSAAVYVQEPLLASFTSIREDGFSWITPAQQTVDELNELMRTNAFMRSVVQLTDLEKEMSLGSTVVKRTLDQAREAVWARTPGRNLITIAAAHEQPKVAHQLAAATLEVYLQWKINADREESDAAILFLKDLAATYHADMETAEGNLRTFLESHPPPVRGDRPGSEQVDIERLQRDLDTAVARYSQTLDNLEATQLSAAVAEGQVRQSYLLLDAPHLPTSPERSKKAILLESAIFIAVGAFLSLIGVVGGALLDRCLRFPEDARFLLELPILASLPDLDTGKST